jgi:hypothetical protein
MKYFILTVIGGTLLWLKMQNWSLVNNEVRKIEIYSNNNDNKNRIINNKLKIKISE